MTNLALTVSRFGGQLVRIDKAWLAVAAVFAVLGLIDLAQARASFVFTVEQLIAKVFEGRLTVMIIVASLFGGLSPFCSCGVIPLIAALLAMGVPVPAIMAFWLSSPVVDPAKFFLATGTLGLDFAIGLAAIAVGIGIYGGFLTRLVMARGAFANPLWPEASPSCCATSSVKKPKTVNWRFWEESERRGAFNREMLDTTLFLLKWLALAFVLESLMIKYLPAETIAQYLGAESAWAIPLAVLTGVPAYLNGFAALPLIDGLLDMGVSAGAGMAFLIAGAVTSMPAAVAVFALVRAPMFLWYVALATSGAAISGVLFQLYAG
jgi:uncharacterized membrane protein YraQ (UPF0718 family)